MNIIDINSPINDQINFLEGRVILIDKPLNWTSFDVVNKIRYQLKRYHGIKKIKVGHNGTLDPLATGLLMIFTGKYTKRIPLEENHDKSYDANIKFGASTDTLDREGAENVFGEIDHLTEEKINSAAASFLGKQIQEIPIYSATKIKGKAMYQLAREGKSFEPKVKEVEFLNISKCVYSKPFCQISINCGKGTYIRAFARDLGYKLNTRAYLYGLIRTSIAKYNIERAIGVEEFCSKLEQLEYNS